MAVCSALSAAVLQRITLIRGKILSLFRTVPGFAVLFLAACATTPAPAPVSSKPASIPAYLQAQTGCAIVAGGDIGSRFSDKQVEENWSKVNAAVTTELHDRLVGKAYKAIKFIVPFKRAGKSEDLVFEHLALKQCNRILQVYHTVDEDDAGKFFRFDIAIFRAVPKPAAADPDARITVVATREYQRNYRYPRTLESLENFYTGTFADQAFKDLQDAGALAALR